MGQNKKPGLLYVRHAFKQYSQSGIVTIDDGCTDVLFVNSGTNTVTVNGFSLTPNSSLELYVPGNKLNDSDYQLIFINTGGTNLVNFIQTINVS